jgi:hypothetical protein
MDRIRADLRDIDKIDIQKQGFSIAKAPPRRALGDVEKKALRSALDLWKLLSPEAMIFHNPLDMADRPPRVDILPPTTVPVGMVPRTRPEATLALGITSQAFKVVGISTSGGIYGSTTRELGVYIGGSVGIWTNAGFGVGPTYTMVFGPPSDFAGVSWGVGVDIGFGLVGLGGVLLFSLPPFRVLGYSVSLSAGVTTLPVNVEVSVGLTKTKPVLNFR